jgi:hypothetical protein
VYCVLSKVLTEKKHECNLANHVGGRVPLNHNSISELLHQALCEGGHGEHSKCHGGRREGGYAECEVLDPSCIIY